MSVSPQRHRLECCHWAKHFSARVHTLRPIKNRRPRRKVSPSRRVSTASARIISRPSVCRSFVAALSPRAKRAQSEGTAVAIIDETLAKNLWPDGDALGQHLQYAEDNAPRAKGDGGDNMGISQGGKGNIKTGEAIEVIGIVPSTRGAFFERQPRGSIYVPFARGFQTAAYFFVQCPFT